MTWYHPIRRLFGERKSINRTLDLWREIYGRGRTSETGRVVTVASALEVSTVLACARTHAKNLAIPSFDIFQEDGPTRTVIKNHPVTQLMTYRANAWQSGIDYRNTMALHLALCSNHFAFRNMVGGRLTELIPFEPQFVAVRQDPSDYSLIYTVRAPNRQTMDFPAEAIWHVRGAAWNSWYGLDAVRLGREAIGLALATEENHAKLHKNASRPGGLYSVEGTLNPDQFKAMKAWIDENFAGSENAFSTMILDRNTKFTPMVMTGVDSQHLETRRFQIEEICRVMDTLPIMVSHYDKSATYASSEQMFLAQAAWYARPLHSLVEASIKLNLLTAKEVEQGYVPSFRTNDLVQRSAADQAAYYQAALGAGGGRGWQTQDEVRAQVGLDPKGGDADKLGTSTTNPAVPTP
jgi:HK97 family phage portal protein